MPKSATGEAKPRTAAQLANDERLAQRARERRAKEPTIISPIDISEGFSWQMRTALDNMGVTAESVQMWEGEGYPQNQSPDAESGQDDLLPDHPAGQVESLLAVTYQWLIGVGNECHKIVTVDDCPSVADARVRATMPDHKPALTEAEVSHIWYTEPHVVPRKPITLAHAKAIAENERLTAEHAELRHIKDICTVRGITTEKGWFDWEDSIQAKADAAVETGIDRTRKRDEELTSFFLQITHTLRSEAARHGFVRNDPELPKADFSPVLHVVVRQGTDLTAPTRAVLAGVEVIESLAPEWTDEELTGQELAKRAIDDKMRGGWGTSERNSVMAYRARLAGTVE